MITRNMTIFDTIIDIHAHTFPEAVAVRALDRLSHSSNLKYYTDGTPACLQKSMRENGITASVLLPVATKPEQHKTINETVFAINEAYPSTGILSLGGIHPDCDNYREILRKLSAGGVKGIKLHPVFQKVDVDDIRSLRLIEYACALDMVVVLHAGYDVSFPGESQASVPRICSMLKQIRPRKMVLAHMGGWGEWNQVEELLAGYPVFVDTSMTITPNRSLDESRTDIPHLNMSCEQFRRITHMAGADHVLFGSDTPWTNQGESVSAVANSGLDESELKLIFSENARRLLGL